MEIRPCAAPAVVLSLSLTKSVQPVTFEEALAAREVEPH